MHWRRRFRTELLDLAGSGFGEGVAELSRSGQYCSAMGSVWRCRARSSSATVSPCAGTTTAQVRSPSQARNRHAGGPSGTHTNGPIYLAGIEQHFNRYLTPTAQCSIAAALQQVIDAHQEQLDLRR